MWVRCPWCLAGQVELDRDAPWRDAADRTVTGNCQNDDCGKRVTFEFRAWDPNPEESA